MISTLQKKYPKVRKSWWSKYKSKIGRAVDRIQTGLDIAGLAPGVGIIPDATNAIIHAIRGNKKGAITSLGAMIPIAGQGVTIGKYGVKGYQKYKSLNIDKLISSGKYKKPYPRGGRTINEGATKFTLKEAVAAFRNSINPKIKVKKFPGVRVGVTPDGRTVTLRTKGGHGPTIEVKGTDNVTNKLRIEG